MLSVKQGGIKYHFLSLWCDSTWDWTRVSRAFSEHSTNGRVFIVSTYFFFKGFVYVPMVQQYPSIDMDTAWDNYRVKIWDQI